MKKKNLLLILSLFSVLFYAQKKESEKEKEDIKYELKHKKMPWFSEMKDGADYFSIKNNFDKYFGNHKWEESRTRELGENWLRSKIFYLDSNGKVVPEPSLNTTPIVKNTLTSTTQTQVGTWTLLGPVNSARTGYSSNYNHGGYVYLNRIDPNNPQRMFASFVTGGLWRTIDGGNSWNLVDAGFDDANFNDIDISVSNPQVIYALSKTKLLKSTDGGLNFTATTLTSSNNSGQNYDLAVSPTDENIVVVRWGANIRRTTDGGTTWTTVQTGLPSYSVWGDCSPHSESLEWDSTDNNAVYCASRQANNIFKIYKSTDAGATFSDLNSTTLDTAANGQVIGWMKIFVPSNNATSFYVAVGTGTSEYSHLAVQMYKFNKTTGALELSRINMITGVGDSYAHDPVLHHGDIQMDRTDENKIAYGSYGNQKIHYSSDNGASFNVKNGYTHHDLRTIDFVNGKIIVGSDGEIAYTSDLGDTFTTLSNSISNHELWGFGSAFKTNLVAAGTNHGPAMIKESGNGFDWYNASGADQGNTDVNPLDDRYVYSQGYSNYRYFRTGVHQLINESNFLDLGGIYSYFNSIEFYPNKYYSIITHHAGQYPTGNANLATWKNSLIKTEDNGNSISIVKTFTNQVFREKISMKNPNTMIVVEGLSNNKLWKTTDGGTNWVDITPSLTASVNQKNISDIAIGDENPNEIWITYSGVQTACKVLKSNDGGTTWTNLTSSVLTSSPLTKMVYQRGSNGGIYVGNKAGVFYRNNTMPDWQMLGNGLPMSEIRFMFINYNENKLKIGTSRGAFENALFEISPPNALISANTNKISCPVAEKIQFKDYSVVRNASATWQWSFPGGTPSTSTLENPEVSYNGAADGTYDVTLTVTDAYGTSTQTLSNFIQINNICGSNQPDLTPGNSVKFSGSTGGDNVKINDLNINKNSFTFSCWIKPNGIQQDYSGIFMSQDGGTFGLNFRGGNNTLGFHPSWTWSSGLIAPADQWSHVALVSNGTDVKIYLNGVEKVNNTAISSEVFNKIILGGYGRGYSDRFTNLEMDEVAIWNRPLTINEIRKWRHLTKSVAGDPILTGLVYYLQFDESVGNLTVNKIGGTGYGTYAGTGYSRQVSNVPVFHGMSDKITVNSSGVKDFTNEGLALEFAPGTYPNGDIWVSKGSINPDQLPNSDTNFGYYTIVNNYGTNSNFTPLTSMSFYGNSDFQNYSIAANYNLFKRNSNDFGSTWGSSIDTGDTITGSGATTKINFISGLNVSSFSQFLLTNSNNTTLSTNNVSEKGDFPKILPNPIKQGEPLRFFIPQNLKNTYVIIYDASGKKVAQTGLVNNNDYLLLNLPKGVYFALFIAEGIHGINQKFIIK